MWELDCEESWPPKNWCFWTVVLEKTLESPLDCKEIQLVHPEGDQSWLFTGRTNVEAETPILWPPDAKSWLIWKYPDVGKDWRQEEMVTTEDEMVRWHHWLNGRVWVNSGNWWWTGRPGALWFMWSQRVGHDLATERDWRINLSVMCSSGTSAGANNKMLKTVGGEGFLLYTLGICYPFQKQNKTNYTSLEGGCIGSTFTSVKKF